MAFSNPVISPAAPSISMSPSWRLLYWLTSRFLEAEETEEDLSAPRREVQFASFWRWSAAFESGRELPEAAELTFCWIMRILKAKLSYRVHAMFKMLCKVCWENACRKSTFHLFFLFPFFLYSYIINHDAKQILSLSGFIMPKQYFNQKSHPWCFYLQ